MTTNLARDIQQVSQLRGKFRLRSGALSDTYFDKYRFEAQPQLLARICSVMARLLPKDTRTLADVGVELRAVLTMADLTAAAV